MMKTYVNCQSKNTKKVIKVKVIPLLSLFFKNKKSGVEINDTKKIALKTSYLNISIRLFMINCINSGPKICP